MLTNFKMIAATLLMSAVAIPASATSIWNVDFEADTVGSAPAVAPSVANVVGTVPTSVTQVALVRDGYTDAVTGASLSSKVLEIAGGRMFINGATNTTSGLYEIEFDMLRDDSDDGTNSFLTVRRANDSSIMAQLSVNPGLGRVSIFQTGASSGAIDSPNGSVNYDNALNIRYRFDLDAATQQIFVDDVLLLSGTIDASFGLRNIDFDALPNDIWVIDNITTSIPEPSSIALISLGLIGMVGLGARRRK